tara:strand:- start:300 stop:1262 length:963 start_codon:yes stop_codon:yes gene_type:complete
MNFFVSEMTFLRYFIPLINEGNKRNIKSTIYWTPSRKYNCPAKHLKTLKKLSTDFNFKIQQAQEKARNLNTSFLIEGIGHQYFDGKKVSLTYMTDFRALYKDYIDKVDYCIFPNKVFLEKYNLPISDKNLFLGSPKYDVNLNKKNILTKYNLSHKKKCLILFPRKRDMHNINLIKIIEELKKLDFQVCIKARGKEPCSDNLANEVSYFEDESWYPHTSMELISACDLVINTDSTSIKECIMLRKPVLNFKIKPFESTLSFLYNNKFYAEIKTPIDYSLIKEKVEYLSNVNNSDFQETIDKLLFESNSSERILDFLKINET